MELIGIIVIIVIIVKVRKNKKENYYLQPPTDEENQEITERKKMKPLFDSKYLKHGYNEEYTKKDYLLTPTELKFYKHLKSITDELNLVICPQVVLYEIIKNVNYKGFNKIQSKCIDFVITEPNLKIKLCIELDDYTHKRPKRIARDDFLDKLFYDVNIKLIRIPVQSFYNLDELKDKIRESL